VVCGFLLLANGATGLAKVALIRVFKISVFKTIRFPLHDHARKNLGWSGAQVLLRFILMHIVISALLVGLLLKVR
jgi:phospho-N-acetylmuramoyl-pentapeptide-transferase